VALGVNIVSQFDAKGIRKAITEFKKLEGAAAKSTYALRTIDSAATNVAKHLAKAGAAAAVLGGFAVRQFAQFDDAMTQSTAIMGNVSDTMRQDMENAARQMAKTTTFTATEAAKSFYFLASAGLDAESSIKALPRVANFAQAGMFDMARATDLLTDAQSALGLTIRDDAVANMQNMTRVSDVLVKANTLANASVEQFSIALTNRAGAAMKAVNMDITEGVAVLAAFADQGIKAEEAGTQFSIVLRELQSKTLKNSEAFKQFGVEVYDSSGNLNNMGTIIGQLETALSGMSDEQKRATLTQMGFSDKSLGSLLALLGTSDAIKTYEEALRSAGGTTDNVAQKQLESLSSQLKLARNALNDVAITIGARLEPIVRVFTDKAQELSEVISTDGLGGGIRYLSDQFLSFTSNLGKTGTVLMAVVAAFVALRLVAIAATISQVAFNTALFANPIGIAVAAIIAFGVAVAAAYLRFEGFRKVVNTVINAVIGYIEFMVNMWIRAINMVIKGINLFGGVLRAVGIDVSELGEIGEVSFGRIGNAAAKTVAKVKDVTQAIADARNAERKAEAAAARAGAGDGDGSGSGVGSGVAKTVKTVKEKLKEYISALKSVQTAERSLISSGREVAKAREDLTKATQRVADAQAKFNQVTRGYGADSKEAVSAMRQVQDAARRLRDANLSQQDSVRSLAAAEKKLADLRALRADPEDIASAERKLERSKYSTEEAVFRVGEAEAELAAIRLDPDSNAVDIRRAEIALAEAKFGVTDATIAQRDAEDDLRKLRDLAASPEELAAAERELERAKYAVEDATQAVRDATLEQSVAQAFYTEIVEGAKEGSEAYKEALENLRDAQDAEREASEKITDQLWREWEATEALRDAKEKLAAVGSEVGGRIVSRASTAFAASMPSTLNGAGGVVAAPMPLLPDSVSITNNISAGMGADSREIAQVIVDSLRDYERSNGYIPVTAQYAIAI
jgi:TP901 family phage tail tape measure protein